MANTHSIDFERTSSQHAWIGDSADLSIIEDISIEAWVKVEDAPNNQEYHIVDKYAGTGTQKSWCFMYNDEAGTKVLYFQVFNNLGSNQEDYLNVDLGTGAWHHIAVTFDASAAQGSKTLFFIDGVQNSPTGSGITITYINDGNADITVGARSSASPVNFFDGLMDEVRIWNDVRTPAEISANRSVQLNGNEANLMAYYMVNNNAEDKGEVTDPAGAVTDDLNLVNSPVYSTDTPFGGATANSLFFSHDF